MMPVTLFVPAFASISLTHRGTPPVRNECPNLSSVLVPAPPTLQTLSPLPCQPSKNKEKQIETVWENIFSADSSVKDDAK
ncbi:hypothetical protein CDES_07260 [Corynebacterium deserti GIMN1.010]|uniref:Uncharacterized protein n=1 Tax=Corynebacterium deserti GIMN1.010 TaxID=931089 RepID=A0A0M4CG40_9CORY|nr:hypothetical protein CDES_07260 [Corynebacterium deserti GIMN1.010]